MAIEFRCAGCGIEVGETAFPFRCPGADAGDGVDHLLVRQSVCAWDPPSAGSPSSNPFERFRHRLTAHELARSHGLGDGAFLDVVRRLDQAVACADGRGFVETPFAPQRVLGAKLGLGPSGALFVKDETGNVSGSHKARHLMGIMLYLQVAERVGLLAARPPLAIASCGNAALAAAVVAKAAGWPLHVFVPPSANLAVLSRLEQLGARINTCRREPGVAGDPCYLAFRRAIADGAVPFCCQGSDNGLTIEGGETLAWEMAAGPAFDAVFVQVGGGALASAVVQGLEGVHDRSRPRIYTVQTAGGYPLARAYDRLVARLLCDRARGGDASVESPAMLARALAQQPALIRDGLVFARTHRPMFMWPWEHEPRSIAHGILDDETYDWAAVVEGMLRTGGRPMVVGEERLREANTLARSLTGIDVDYTGSAGLAGLLEALEQEPGLRRERVAVIFSGVRRS